MSSETNFNTEPPEKTQNPVEDQSGHQKRNSGRTGPTSEQGKATSARNATRHGLCSELLVLSHESEADWLDVLHSWLDSYQNPAESSLLYSFVFKTARAEWFHIRAQKEYDGFFQAHGNAPITTWEPFEVRLYELVQRYLTAAERRFQREYRMLEQRWKTYHKPAPEPKKNTKETDPSDHQMPGFLYVNNETGEAVDAFGNEYPPPPNYKPEPIIPGVYGPDHPSNFRPGKKQC